MNDELMAKISDEEIKEAAFSMGGLKAPGPDGLNGLFFQHHWDILSKEVCGVVKQIFEDGNIPEGLGETTVVLIPKVTQPESLNHLRPISCCNFIYKILTRVLVGRLRKVLDAIISSLQSAFVKGRLIQDNIVIVQEAFHKLNRKENSGSENLAIKLDMNKAYDRLEWNFLQRVMEEFGFNNDWVKLMMSCVRSATYRFKINGILSTKIYPQRGAQEEEIYQLIQIINKYTEASGQRINTEKSGLIFGSQVSIQRRVNIEEITGMASWEDPGRYLGSDGQYTVKIGYRYAKEEKDIKEETKLSKASTSQNLREVWEVIWRLPVPQKVRMFLWRAVHRILSVNIILYQRKNVVRPTCSICQDEEETIEHALLLCPWTKAVWFGSSLQIVPTVYNVTSFEKWLMDTIQKIKSRTGKEHEKFLCNLGCVCWCIWKARNQHIFQQTKVNPENIIISSEHLAADYHNATKGLNMDNIPRAGIYGERRRVTWRPPPYNRLKANTDATFHKKTGKAASAVVIRNWQGKIITGTTSTFTTTSALAAEAQAYREALILIKNLQIPDCLIETDCLPLIQAIKARMLIAEADVIIRDILQLLDDDKPSYASF
ncbi:uncharacterized protein [Arachis hypogaea]|uniref:uncharacterized protein n=1 Tax=Arachis hypogaea TaxID=3818 RepID=UPI003B215515